jgi:hypothetical protein
MAGETLVQSGVARALEDRRGDSVACCVENFNGNIS